MKLRNKLIATGAAALLSSVFANQADVEAATWTPRTVEEIHADIQEEKANQEESEPVEYTIKDGDTLWGISEATGISVDALTQVNDIANRHLIITGNTIYLSDDNSVLSVKDENDQLKSYEVSEEVKETETPQEVTEREEDKQEQAEVPVQEDQNQEQAEAQAQEAEQAPEQAQEAAQDQEANDQAGQVVAQPASNQGQDQASANTGSFIGTFNATAYAIGDGLTPSTVTANGTDVSNTIYSNGRRIIAVDPNVIPLNSTVIVEMPNGSRFTAVAADTGGAINGNTIDLLVSSPAEAQSFGRQSGIKIYRAN